VLGVTAERVVSEECAKQMAEGAGGSSGRRRPERDRRRGPDELEGQPVGTVWFGLALPDRPAEAVRGQLPGDRERVRQFSTISLLNLLRLRLLEREGSGLL